MVFRKYMIIMALPLILVSQNVRYDRILEENTFILVIDRSGSMSGNAIQDTKTGSLHFISRMRKDDKACLITFSDNISVNVPITSDRGEIIRGVKSISASGGTKLYDALAMGVKQFFDDSGRRIIVYLTDGRDNGSNFSLDNMQSMFQGENIFVYGIGIGDVDNSSLSKISKVTGGNYHTISKNNTHKLSTIYFDVLSAFYTNHTNKITSHGALIVNSIPKGKIVRINGENSGMTPIKVTNLQPGQVSVEVYFENDKIWKENIEIKGGFTASVRAREIDALKNLWIISKPHGASVFIDGEYVGYTSNEIVNLKKRKWHKNVVKNPKELKVVGLKPDLHKIEIIGFPDFDYGPEQKVVVDYLLEGDDIIFIDIFKNVIKNKSGKVTPGKQRKDVFEF